MKLSARAAIVGGVVSLGLAAGGVLNGAAAVSTPESGTVPAVHVVPSGPQPESPCIGCW